MSDFISAVALHVVHYTDEDDKTAIRGPGDSPFRISIAQFSGLEELGAVRRATRLDKINPLDHDLDGRAGGAMPPVAPVLTPKHKGGGKWIVIDADGENAAGDDLFEDKEAAQAWIDNHRELSDEEKLIRDEVVNPDPDAEPDAFSG